MSIPSERSETKEGFPPPSLPFYVGWVFRVPNRLPTGPEHGPCLVHITKNPTAITCSSREALFDHLKEVPDMSGSLLITPVERGGRSFNQPLDSE